MELPTEFWALLVAFWALVMEVLKETAFGTSFGRILVAVLVFALLLVARGLFARFFIGWLKRLVRGTRTQIDDYMVEALEKPLRFAPVVLAFFVATRLFDLTGTFDRIALRLT